MSELNEFRKAKDQFFATDQHSPLLPEQQHHFKQLEYFPENADLQFVLELEEFPKQEEIEIITSTGEVQPQLRWGTVAFTVDGQKANLTVYKGKGEGEFFLPFADSTSGNESYGAGRYLELVALHGNKYLLDFNYAYNPYCAYNPQWSCPIPPAENRLQVPIKAGERAFPGVIANH